MLHRIVVCDDEAHITRAIAMKLSKAGFDVETASDGKTGWEAIQRAVPSAVITDYQMPRMDGIALIRKLRDADSTRNLPVILLTAKGFELDDAQLKDELGIAEIVVKPFSPRELLKTVQSLIEGVTIQH